MGGEIKHLNKKNFNEEFEYFASCIAKLICSTQPSSAWYETEKRTAVQFYSRQVSVSIKLDWRSSYRDFLSCPFANLFLFVFLLLLFIVREKK